MTKRFAREDGIAVATAIIVLTLMLMFGMAMMALVDTQTQQSGRERVKETSYNVAEATLSNEVFAMSHPWPGTAAQALPDCTRATAATQCPSAAAIAQGFQGTEFNANTTWTVTVRDNLGSAANYYNQNVLNTTPCAVGGGVPCKWDSNGDGLLWIRAQATVAGRTRTIVTLARQQQVALQLPLNVVLAGKFSTTNNGKKVIVDEKGCFATGAPPGKCLTSQSAPVAVRCSLGAAGTKPSPGNACLGYDPNKGQLSPDNYVTNYAGAAAGCANGYSNCVLTADQVDGLKRRAVAAGTYFASSCPASLTGAVVFIDNPPAGSCSYNGGTWNAPTSPGMVVMNHGTLSLGGNIKYYGIIYSANGNSAPTNAGNVVSLSGTATIQGAILVEGPGGVLAGSSKINIVFDPSAESSLFGYGDSAAIAQNSYRELPTGQ